MSTQNIRINNSVSYHFPLKYRKYIAIVPNAGSQELLTKQLEEFRSLRTTSFSYDKAWTKGRALYMGIEQERLVCLKTKTRKMPKGHVVLCVRGDELAVIHVEKDLHELDCDAFNQVVEAFQEECLMDEVMRHFKLRERVEYEPLDSVMSVGAAEALVAWEESCCLDSELVFSYDNKLWNELMLAINRNTGNEKVTGDFQRCG